MKRILIVEDEMSLQMITRQCLLEAGYAISGSVSTGEEAFHLFSSQGADLVILDMSLAGRMDGVETAEMIRSLSDVPLIFITGSGNDCTLKHQASVAGFSDFLEKPVEVEILLQAVNRAFEGLNPHH